MGSLATTSGSSAGGSSVVITGTSFLGATAVSFGGSSASFTVDSDTQITATAPAHSAGVVDVRVTNSGGTSSTTAADQFTYASAGITLSPASPLTAATVGAAYSNTVSASGGTGPYTFAVTAGALPAGVSLASGGGFSGTPTAAGNFNFTITATDTVGGASGSQAYALTVSAPTITVSPGFPPNMTVGQAYSQTFTASGGTSAYAFSVSSGALPAGMTLSGAGVLSGTPTEGGLFNFTITATDSSTGTGAPFTGSHAYSLLSQRASVTTTPSSLPDGAVGAAYSRTISGSGGTAPYTFMITGGALPAGLSLNGSTGAITGTPTAAGAFTVFISAIDSSTGAGPYSGGQSYSFNISAPTITVSPNSVSLTQGMAPGVTFAGSGGTSGYTFAVTSGALPNGLTLNSSTGALTGAPTSGGSYSFTVTATDSTTGTGPFTGSRAYSGTVVVSTPPTAVNTTVIIPYGATTLSIDLSSVVTGVASNIQVMSQPVHGSAAATGMTVNFNEATAFSGSDSFTYKAAGPGGVSANTATVTITRGNPPAPTTAGTSATVDYGSPGKAIDLSSSITGVATGVTVTSAPSHGSTSVSGEVVTYVPASGYQGPDSFQYTANGPGGSSAPATVTLTVTAPAAPIAGAKSVSTPYQTQAAIDLTASITGAANTVTVTTPAAHGTTSVSGKVVTYTPASGYYGNDSFAYTASGAGGTSAPATVSITVGTPPAPTASAKSATVPYASSGTAIDLSGSITGVATGVTVATNPTHGNVSVSGTSVTYTPLAGYYGADSFTYRATGPGGGSSPATVSITVSNPAAPTAAAANLTAPYNGSGTALDLSGSITGVATSVTVSTAPTHGTATASGKVVTYKPTTGYFGPDSFAYTATGPGGTSSPATVTVTVSNPPAPFAKARSVSVPYNSAGVAIDMTSSVTGVASSVAVVAAPTKGSVTASGMSFTYTPTPGAFGADSFTYTASGIGGTSNTETVSVTIAPPPAPTVSGTNATVQKNGGNQTIDLSGDVSGVFTRLTVTTAPSHGSLRISGTTATYKPATDYTGPDSFMFTATGPGGTSAPATVNIAVRGADHSTAVPTAQAFTATTVALTPVTVDLASGSTGGPITAANVTSVSPSGAGTTAIVQAGAAFNMTFTPGPNFVGTAVINFTLTSAGGTSAPSTVTVTVTRPDPSANAEVKGLVAAQDQAARTFARAQISNFDRRMEDLHAPGGGGSSFGMGLNFGDYGSNQYIDPNQNPLERMRLEETSDPFHQADQFRDAKLFADNANSGAAHGQGRLAAGGAGSGTMAAPGGAAIWAAGTIDLGQRSAQLGQDKVKFQSSGLTVGADMPVGEHWIMGAGVGWGHSDDQVGSGGTKSTATNWVGAIYASWEPAPNLFLDGVVGAGSLKFDTRRLTPALDFVTGSRNGSETFGSLTLAYEWRRDGFHLSPYGRLDAANASLHGYAETGNTTWALTYGSQKANLLSGDLGLRGDWIVHQGYGDMLPHFRIEARHEFEGSNAVNLQYSAALSGPTYTVTPVPASRDTVDLGIGSAWSFKNGFLFSLDYQRTFADSRGDNARVTLRLKTSF
ncbi:MAG: autotransporter domain-containing protein [Proteobacteria bacterium]|nr:autotransporter domain-containing protein [Pseudomonadota bacterium]